MNSDNRLILIGETEMYSNWNVLLEHLLHVRIPQKMASIEISIEYNGWPAESPTIYNCVADRGEEPRRCRGEGGASPSGPERGLELTAHPRPRRAREAAPTGRRLRRADRVLRVRRRGAAAARARLPPGRTRLSLHTQTHAQCYSRARSSLTPLLS